MMRLYGGLAGGAMALAVALGPVPAFAACSFLGDGQVCTNIAATTTAVRLPGGKYGVDVVATFGGGSVKLQKQAADATTYVSVSSATDFTAAGYAVIDLPSGLYRLTIATASAIYTSIARIPAGQGQ